MKNSNLEFNNNFLNQIILHCIQNDSFIKKARNTVSVDLMRSMERKKILSMIYEYYDEFKCAPKENFFDVFVEYEEQMDDTLYDKCISLIGVIKDITGSNPEYIASRIHDALCHFQLEEASVEFASLIKKKQYDEAKSVILKAMRPPEGLDSDYFDFFEDKSYIEDRLRERKFRMSTLIPGLDTLVGGFNPPWLITLLGATKIGKTWNLLDFAVAGVLQGLNVVIFSLEMDKNMIKGRLDQIIGFLSSYETDDPQETMECTNGSWAKSQAVLNSIYNIDLVEKNTKRLRKISGGGLKISAFNRGRINYLDVDRTLDELEEREGFIADMIVVDYLGIMKETTVGQSKKERITENCLGLKEICGKRNLIGITAMQGNRKAMQASVFHSHMVADDIDTIFTSDLVLAICQTKQEEKLNRCRYYVANFRHGKQFTMVGIVRDLTIGQPSIGEFEISEEEDDEQTEGQLGEDY